MIWNFKYCCRELRWLLSMVLMGVLLGGPAPIRAESARRNPSLVARLDAVEVRIDRGHRHVEQLRAALRETNRNRQLHSAPVDTARRARRKVRGEVARQLIAWERAYRGVERAAHYSQPGQAADTRILLAAAQPEALRTRVDEIGVLQMIAVDLRRTHHNAHKRAGMLVEIAQSVGEVEAAESGRNAIIDQAHSPTHHTQVKRELAVADEELENALGMLLRNDTERDFHRLKGTLRPPVSAPISVGYGPRKQANSLTFVRHTGLTWKIPVGSTVKSVAAGIVVFAGRMAGFGEMVILDHGQQYHSIYAHLKSLDVRVGEAVQRGARLGASGQSGSFNGPKLYFELRKNGLPIDPTPWFIQP